MTSMRPILFLISILIACDSQPAKTISGETASRNAHIANNHITRFDTSAKTIHVLVALCDNKYQGIVPVPTRIGNGQDTDNNLYWGCGGGIREYFKKSSNWQFIRKYKVDSIRLERVVFRHKKSNYYLIADAYDGRYIRKCTIDFLKSCSGQFKDTLMIKDKTLGINGNSKLVAYIGHNGLMDFSLDENFSSVDNHTRDAIILACISKRYFSNHLRKASANPILWSTGLMSPEAYTLHDALESYVKGEPAQDIRNNAAGAYSRYQKCSIKASKNLLVSGY